ncbi:MAG TPA: DUF6089 family protein [Cyclobacteriaceae bacterium]|nr:DUF6089 family protein [Cyclobacteriaceae bacterium]
MRRGQIKRNNKKMGSYQGMTYVNRKYNAVGVSFDALNYYGDLAPLPEKFSTDLSLTRPGVGLYFKRKYGSFYSLQASFLYGTIKGSDHESADRTDTQNGVYRYQRNLSFRNRIKELSVVGVFDLFKNQQTYLYRADWTPYGFFGIALFHNNPQALAPKTDLNGNALARGGEWVDLQPLGTEGQYASLKSTDANYKIKPYSRTQVAIPLGIGVRVRLKTNMDISGEFGFRYVFTDYLDDVSRNYVDLGSFGNNELAKALSYRSNEIGPPNHTYTSEYDGMTYNVLAGYGSEHQSNIRGNKKDRDLYTVMSVKVAYILKPKVASSKKKYTKPKSS